MGIEIHTKDRENVVEKLTTITDELNAIIAIVDALETVSEEYAKSETMAKVVEYLALIGHNLDHDRERITLANPELFYE